MIIQPTPLYAVNEAGEFVQVIGWTQDRSTGRIWPEVIALGKFGSAEPQTERGRLAYLAEAPILDPIIGKPSPADAQTEVIQRPDSWKDSWLDPDDRPVY